MSQFVLGGLPPLSRSTVDRQEPLRDDIEHQLAGWPKARVVLVDSHGGVEITDGPSGVVLATTPATEFGDRPPQDAVLLGEQDDIAYWAMAMESGKERGPDYTDTPGKWVDLRGSGGMLNDTDAGLFVTAVAVLNWQRRSGYCARCGSPVEFRRAGWASWCVRCQHEEYPRTDPAVICLVHDGAGANGEQVLLATQPNWPEHRYSVLAGFVEAGEALEATVVREIREEVGIDVHSVRYLASQPWPFPRSLMIGFTAIADPSVPLVPADGEIQEARWVSRETLRAAYAANGTPVEGIAMSPNASIASAMLRSWLDAG